jgi:hypothetical protein
MAILKVQDMPTKKPQVTAYVRPIVNEALDQAALDDQRSRSQMAAILIEEALKARGYLNNSIQQRQARLTDTDGG